MAHASFGDSDAQLLAAVRLAGDTQVVMDQTKKVYIDLPCAAAAAYKHPSRHAGARLARGGTVWARLARGGTVWG